MAVIPQPEKQAPIVVLPTERALSLQEILPKLEGGANPQKRAIRLGDLFRIFPIRGEAQW